jgi:5-methylcytosine-specific restriction endonuclease McrA
MALRWAAPCPGVCWWPGCTLAKAYKEKLLDPRWQKKRLEVFNRDDWRCQGCGRKDRTLHVHHLRYTGEPWEAPLLDLETVCEDCHSERGRVETQFKLLGAWRVLNEMPEIMSASDEEMAWVLAALHEVRKAKREGRI